MKETVDFVVRKNVKRKRFVRITDGSKFVPDYIGTPMTEEGVQFAKQMTYYEAEVGADLAMSAYGVRNGNMHLSLEFHVSENAPKETTIEVDGVKIYDPRHKELEDLDSMFWKSKSRRRKEELLHQMISIKRKMGIYKF